MGHFIKGKEKSSNIPKFLLEMDKISLLKKEEEEEDDYNQTAHKIFK